MFEVIVKHHFCAAHSLRGYPGKCVNTHGHNFEVEVTVVGDRLNSLGLVVDFKDVKALLNGIIEDLDHQNLNELEAFASVNPSTENIAKYLHDRLKPLLPVEVNLRQVKVCETGSYSATYRE